MIFYERLERLCKGFGDTKAFCDIYNNETVYTYMDFFADVKRYMGYFQTCSARRIAIMGAGSYEWVCQVYGALSVGKDIIPLDPYQNLTNLTAMLKYSEAEMVLHDEPDAEFEKAFSDKLRIVYRGYIKEEELCFHGTLQPKDGTMMFFTSGTNRLIKGTVIALDRFWNSLEPGIPLWNEGVSFGPEITGEQVKIYIPIPMQAIYGSCMCLLHLMQGCCIYFGNARKFVTELIDIDPHIMVGVSTMIQILLQIKKPKNLKVVMSSGGPCREELALAALEKGVEIRNIYGASELGGLAFNKYGDGIRHLTPLTGNEIRIDENHVIWMRSPNRMLGYYHLPGETEALYDGEWFTLDDLGSWNEDGTFRIEGRSKHMIAMENGAKLYLEEIEEQLETIPGVLEAGILYLNQKIIAVLVVEDDQKAEEVKLGIRDYNKDQQFQYKIGESWIRKEPLPRLELHKIARKVLEEQYLSGKS